jgi:hypothetical protein
MSMVDPVMTVLVLGLGLCAFLCLIVGIWYFATGRRKELAMTSEQLERYRAVDPDSAPARALYTSATIDSHHRDKAGHGKSGGDYDHSSEGGGGD